MMAPTIAELISEGCYITKIDVDSNPGLVAQYDVKSIPTFILAENDNEILRKVGPQSKESLKQLFN
jgi:hypothetical protein